MTPDGAMAAAMRAFLASDAYVFVGPDRDGTWQLTLDGNVKGLPPAVGEALVVLEVELNP